MLFLTMFSDAWNCSHPHHNCCQHPPARPLGAKPACCLESARKRIRLRHHLLLPFLPDRTTLPVHPPILVFREPQGPTLLFRLMALRLFAASTSSSSESSSRSSSSEPWPSSVSTDVGNHASRRRPGKRTSVVPSLLSSSMANPNCPANCSIWSCHFMSLCPSTAVLKSSK